MQIDGICIMSYPLNMQMNRIIYECLRLPQCSHNLQRVFFFFHTSPLLYRLAWRAPHSQTRPVLNKHTHKRGCRLGTVTDWENLSGRWVGK